MDLFQFIFKKNLFIFMDRCCCLMNIHRLIKLVARGVRISVSFQNISDSFRPRGDVQILMDAMFLKIHFSVTDSVYSILIKGCHK